MHLGLFTGTLKSSDLRHLDDGRPVCNFGLELTPVSDTQLPFTLATSAWDDLAVQIADLVPGTSLTIEGYPQTEVNEKDGVKQKHVLVTATRLAPFNTLVLIGRVGGDPEVKQVETKDGSKTVAQFTLAVDKSKRDIEPDWYNIEAWGRTAEIVSEYVHKGSQVGVTGSLRLDRWQDKATGAGRSKPVVQVQRLDLLGGKQTGKDTTEF